jgi:hypothetical protein
MESGYQRVQPKEKILNIIKGGEATTESMFKTMGGWTTQFEINGNLVGGHIDILTKDPRLIYHLEVVGGAKDKRILELGPLEGAHTKMMVDAGAKEVIAIEGNPDCFLRCLIVKEAFQLTRAKFLFGDFNLYVKNYTGDKFDFISAAGVLYHQINPAQLIHDMARITDTVIVWAQVASDTQPSNIQSTVMANDIVYKGKLNSYMGTRATSAVYCGGLNDDAFWMYPEDMRKCFVDAGFTNINEQPMGTTVYGNCLTFVAQK